MTENDMPEFLELFQSIRRVFPLRGTDDDLRDLSASYFKALQGFPLRDVRIGSDRYLQKATKFPKPADWISSIPKRTRADTLPLMSWDDRQELQNADAINYEAAPCQCSRCVEAGVNDKPIRFVPDGSADSDTIRFRDPNRPDHIVCRGHWAHGAELARWYETRANFWNAMLERFPTIANSLSQLLPIRPRREWLAYRDDS